MDDSFHVLDTTLRDGAQREGISYSVADKLAVARLLDQVGVGFIEGGWPGAMPKDTEFFARAKDELSLRHAQLSAFGATRKAGVKAANDNQVIALLESQAPVVTVVAKSDIRHVTQALRTTADENLSMITDTVALLVAEGRRVFVDCEHFFDGYRYDPAYGIAVLEAAFSAGAQVGVLCDTNGGMLPSHITATVTEVIGQVPGRIGIHCQDDTSCAVANTFAAVEAGATHVQCTANGYGERAGNADLFAVIGGLVTKMNRQVIPDECVPELTMVSHAIADIANLAPRAHQPYVGGSAFAHKAGLHASAIKVNPDLYNHLDPETVGNRMRILVTEMAGRASVELKARELGIDLSTHPEATSEVVNSIKQLEATGWSFEAADASFELLVRSALAQGNTPEAVKHQVPHYFQLESYRVIVEHQANGQVMSEATVKLIIGASRVIHTAEGNGPVNALDNALRSALSASYPELGDMDLTDYKVRVLPGSQGTDAVTRVLIDNADKYTEWTTVGVHENVIEASWHALVEALTYGIYQTQVRNTHENR